MLGSNRPSDSQAEGCVEALGGFRLPVPGENNSPRGRFFVLAMASERSDLDRLMVFGLCDCAGQQSPPFRFPPTRSGNDSKNFGHLGKACPKVRADCVIRPQKIGAPRPMYLVEPRHERSKRTVL